MIEGIARIFLFAENLEQARSGVEAIIKAKPTVFEENMPTHFARQWGAGFFEFPAQSNKIQYP